MYLVFHKLKLELMDQTDHLFSSKFFFSIFSFLLLHNSSFFLTCSAKESPHDITTDTSALLAFRDQLITTSDHFLIKNWTTTTSVCRWVGVKCGTRHKRVVALELRDLGLTGTVSPHLGNLSFLSLLDISNNSFHGKLPEEMASLGRMGSLSVCLNNFVGTIPSWLGSLPQLWFLCLEHNNFTGPIPPSISNCSNLQYFSTSYNPVFGMIPPEFGKLSNLKVVYMEENNLTGPIPPSLFNISSLEILGLTSNGISGSLPADVCGNLPKLNTLLLSENEMVGQILSDLESCTSLELLSLSYNKFHGRIPSSVGNLTMLNQIAIGGNNLEGKIPPEFAHLVKLDFLGLESAGLSGSIPSSIFNNLTALATLYLWDNSLSGSIPSEIGNCTSMNYLSLQSNNLTGIIPESLGNLRNLEYFNVGANNLRGHVPTALFNITTLTTFSVSVNHLTGHLPPTMGLGLPNLVNLYFGGNEFSGTIPDSISNASKLAFVDLNGSKFIGSFPGSLGNLRLLEWLDIEGNNLKLGTTFIASLKSCKHLRILRINSNSFNGTLPSFTHNLSTSLQQFEARNCGIMGRIPVDIGNLSNLAYIDLAQNHIVGSLPNTIQRLSNLQQLSVSGNRLGGVVPNGLCHLQRLGYLDLGENEFISPLPDCLGNMSYSLRYLYLGANKFSSNIPPSLWTLKDLLTLDVSSNSFTGHLPPDVGSLRAAGTINLSKNQLFGSIPTAIGSLLTLVNLSLAHNSFNGSIPESFGKLVSIEYLDLSGNNLSGTIPRTLESLSHLKYLNLSFNQLSGEIPSGGQFQNLINFSFQPNKALCGSPRFKVQQCQQRVHSSKHLTKRKKVVILVAVTLVTLFGLASLFLWLKHRKTTHVPSTEDTEPATAHERISYHELVQATNSFDESNLLGKGSFGSVYKGVFANGRTLAVKVFHLQVERAIRSFDTECEILRNIRHRNLTKVISSCSNADFKALILEYMPNGNLDKWLYSHNYNLDVSKRLDIMIDVASALDYLHHGYSIPIVHCDLKPSNVLLDKDMVAHVSDFGISKILNEGSIEQTNTLATIGYAAPEYGREGWVSISCDIYSFGIMLMEVFTRRRPTDDTFNGDLDLKSWVKESLPDRVMEVIDTNLVKQEEHKVDKNYAVVQCVSIILELACKCSVDSPKERVNMEDVLKSLKKAKVQLLADLI